MGKYCFGIDVGGTSVKCGLFQTDGVLVEKWEIPTRKENSGEAILPDIAKTILDKIAERKLDKEEIDGVGIGVPGPVNERGEVPCAVNLFWGFKEVTKELTELTGLPSKAGNDANVAALGEAWKGAAAGAKNVILVTLGTGVGGGIIVDGKIVGGAQMVTGGSVAVKDPELFCHWLEVYGSEKIILGADVKEHKIAVNGWKDESACELFPFLEDYINKGIQKVICTDISCDGMLKGPSIDLYKEMLEKFPNLYLMASGGVSNVDDIIALNEAGVPGVIFGKALYEGHITLKDLRIFL